MKKTFKITTIIFCLLATALLAGIYLPRTLNAQPSCVPIGKSLPIMEIVPGIGAPCETWIRYCIDVTCSAPVLAQNANCTVVATSCQAANTYTVSGTVTSP